MLRSSPSEVPPARLTIPKGKSAAVAEEAAQISLQVFTRFSILQA